MRLGGALGRLGDVLGRSACDFGPLGALLVGSWEPLGNVWRTSRAVLRVSWDAWGGHGSVSDDVHEDDAPRL
mgnify:CR=1 FL=1